MVINKKDPLSILSLWRNVWQLLNKHCWFLLGAQCEGTRHTCSQSQRLWLSIIEGFWPRHQRDLFDSVPSRELQLKITCDLFRLLWCWVGELLVVGVVLGDCDWLLFLLFVYFGLKVPHPLRTENKYIIYTIIAQNSPNKWDTLSLSLLLSVHYCLPFFVLDAANLLW